MNRPDVKLYFKKLELHDGINYTIRLQVFCRYYEIPQFVLEHEHDSSCTNFGGLNKAMELAYPGFTNDKFYMNSYVTCLGFHT